jgi:hypothetical protein
MIARQIGTASRSLRRLLVGFAVCHFLVSGAIALRAEDLRTDTQLSSPDRSIPGLRGQGVAQVESKYDRRTIRKLTADLKSKSQSAREYGAASLGAYRSPRAVHPLIEALGDRDPFVRAYAATSLRTIGRPAVDPLAAVLKGKNPFAVALAAMALTGIDDPRATSAIRESLLDRNTRAILGIHTYLVRLGEPGSENGLIETLAKYPNRDMAEEFFNSGNPTLSAAARAWARRYNQSLGPARASGAGLWGSGVQPPSEMRAEAIPPMQPTPAQAAAGQTSPVPTGMSQPEAPGKRRDATPQLAPRPAAPPPPPAIAQQPAAPARGQDRGHDLEVPHAPAPASQPSPRIASAPGPTAPSEGHDLEVPKLHRPTDPHRNTPGTAAQASFIPTL